MRLNLYESIDYLCIASDELRRYDHLSNLSVLRTHCTTASLALPEDELLLCCTFDPHDRSVSSPVYFGAGPFPDQSVQTAVPLCRKTLHSGAYLFYQFPDTTPEGIETAYQTALSGLDARGWHPREHFLMLRGVKEGPWYALQVLIPLEENSA